MEDILASGSLVAIGRAFNERRLSVREAVGWYLKRIEALNHAGPCLNAVREIAPDALDAARRADDELAAGRRRGLLHGIPVLVKDNILVAGMSATAGAAALKGFKPRCDATLVARLRAAGAIVIGKTNLTEFADYVSDVMPSGFSGAGGMVKNPHGVAPYGRGLGSSVGSAAAVAARLVPVAIGSETQNSIQTPSCVSSVYGFKPSVGMVSRAGVVPLVPSQDLPGPIAGFDRGYRVGAVASGWRRQRRHGDAGNAARSVQPAAAARSGDDPDRCAAASDGGPGGFRCRDGAVRGSVVKIIESRCRDRRSVRSAERRAVAGRALLGVPHRIQSCAEHVPA